MLDHAKDAISFTADVPWDALRNDKMRRYALLRALEVVGEAATRLPEEIREDHPTIPWSSIIGLRNRLIHGYDSIDDERLRLIVTAQLPQLVQDLSQLLEEMR